MDQLAELAGNIAAHAIWCVSDGGPLTPICATQSASGERQLQRFVAETLEQGVDEARRTAVQNPSGANCGVALFDGYYRFESGRTDAVYLELHQYGERPLSVTMAVPYRNKDDVRGFAVYRLKFLSAPSELTDFNAFVEAFWRGVDSHEQGSAVWNAHLDQSQ